MVTFKKAHDIRLKTGYIVTYCSPIQTTPIRPTKAHKDHHYYATTDQPVTNIKEMYKKYAKSQTQSTQSNSLIITIEKDKAWFYVCYKKGMCLAFC